MGGDISIKGWITQLYKCVLTLSMEGDGGKGVSPLDRFFCYSGGSREEGVVEDADMTI